MSELHISDPNKLAEEIAEDMNRRAETQGTTMNAILKHALSTQIGFGERFGSQTSDKDPDPTL